MVMYEYEQYPTYNIIDNTQGGACAKYLPMKCLKN